MMTESKSRLGVTCPHCDARAHQRSSKGVLPTYREIYYACTNLHCGHSWKATLSFLHTLSPSAMPRPGLNLPIAPPTAFCPRRPLPHPANDPGTPPLRLPVHANDDDPLPEGLTAGG